jgi:hypothetical protein
MNPVAPATAVTALRGLSVTAAGVTFTATAPAIAAAIGIVALVGLAAYVLTKPHSSVRLKAFGGEAELKRD